MSNSFCHKILTDSQWNKINFLFPNAILWMLRWRDLPARYGHWNSIYHKLRHIARQVGGLFLAVSVIHFHFTNNP